MFSSMGEDYLAILLPLSSTLINWNTHDFFQALPCKKGILIPKVKVDLYLTFNTIKIQSFT